MSQRGEIVLIEDHADAAILVESLPDKAVGGVFVDWIACDSGLGKKHAESCVGEAHPV